MWRMTEKISLQRPQTSKEQWGDDLHTSVNMTKQLTWNRPVPQNHWPPKPHENETGIPKYTLKTFFFEFIVKNMWKESAHIVSLADSTKHLREKKVYQFYLTFSRKWKQRRHFSNCYMRPIVHWCQNQIHHKKRKVKYPLWTQMQKSSENMSKQNLWYLKRRILYYQVDFISGMQGWFNIWK